MGEAMALLADVAEATGVAEAIAASRPAPHVPECHPSVCRDPKRPGVLLLYLDRAVRPDPGRPFAADNCETSFGVAGFTKAEVEAPLLGLVRLLRRRVGVALQNMRPCRLGEISALGSPPWAPGAGPEL